ncbi:phage late control D family protein [Streptomyces phaeochromogenes]|uniref:phage late control D family protein n=1 Tax=Streptomyces phaeochromogenes TaxID=1923 RepID=UPI002E1048D1|nr:contractile injection system protein, VgrG/Pvc8 family [Streptomyces phaeochromogenes]
MTETTPAVATPVFRVRGALSPDLARDCVRLEVTESTQGLRTLRAHLVATDSGAPGPPGRMRHLDGREVDLGHGLQVSLGPDQQQRYVFDGTVSGIEVEFRDGSAPVVILYAEDQLMRLRMTRRMHTYQRTTDAQIAGYIARAHGLQADVDADGARYDVVQQLNQSDLAFLRERARLIQAELWCTGTTLHFRTRDKREGTDVIAVQGNHLLSARIGADLAHQRGSVIVTGYDPYKQRTIEALAGPEVLDAETSGGRTGPRLVRNALAESASYRVREPALTVEEARSYANAEMLRRGRRFVTMSGLLRGNADLAVGGRLELNDVGGPFEGGGYYVTYVQHSFDQVSGFRTCFHAERATMNEVA